MSIHDDRNDVTLVVRIPASLRDALKERATEEDRSVASLLRVAAREYLSGATGVRQS